MSLLPISDETLCYGSANGGNTCMNSDPKLDKLMKRAAKILNLKPPRGGGKQQAIVYGPAGTTFYLYFVRPAGKLINITTKPQTWKGIIAKR